MNHGNYLRRVLRMGTWTLPAILATLCSISHGVIVGFDIGPQVGPNERVEEDSPRSSYRVTVALGRLQIYHETSTWVSIVPIHSNGFHFYDARDPEIYNAEKWTYCIANNEDGWEFLGLGYWHDANDTFIIRGHIVPYSGREFDVPIFPVMLLSCIPLISRLITIRRASVRRRRGLCVKCGYNVSMSEHRCPECGNIIVVQPRILKELQ
jgi:predicted RNA-binding Zn-ribbon protein involved in translation (DUF1610 family)